MRAQPTSHTRAWVNRWLEVTTARLKELHVMRQEAEEKVRGVLEDQESSEKGGRCQSMTCGKRKTLDKDQTRPRHLELEHIQEEVLVRLRRSKLEDMTPPEELEQDLMPDLEESQDMTLPEQDLMPDLEESQGMTPPEQDLMPDLEGSQAKGHSKKLGQWSVESTRPARTMLEVTQDHSLNHPQTPSRQNQASDQVTSNHPWPCQSSVWTRRESRELEQTTYNVEKMEEQSEDREPLLSALPTEPASLRRIGSGSFAPRLRLGSSGVTSDLLFTRRMSGNCMSAHSSGFYETSDLDSTSSSCSSLCSDISCHTSVSLMSPHRSSVMRPRSIDCSLERKKELQSAMAQTKRPMSAGALDGYFLRSSPSRFDLAHSYDVAPCDYPFSGPPPLCAIQQRRKAERYICKMALKYRCRPGVSAVIPDLGPPTPRRPTPSFSAISCPPSPQVTSLSSSLVDVRKHSTGSWGRFLSRVMLKKDSRIAASELNLERCGRSSRDALRSPSLAEGQFMRAKSFRDLLSVYPFKRSQRGLNKAW